MLSGAFTAIVTPFAEDGSIDYPAFARLLAWHESEGINGVVVAGTNGEGPSLSAPEKRDLVAFAVQHGSSLKVVAGLGTCAITEAIWLSNQAQKAGAVASLALPPFYFRPALEDGIAAWFDSLLSASDLPCILYNFPQTTGFTFTPELLDRLFAYEHVIGVKDSSGDESLLQQYLKMGRSVFVGNEKLISKCLEGGGSGTISGLANSFPRLISRLVHEGGEVLQQLVDEAVANVKCHPQPAVHKWVLDLKGLPGGCARAPLQELPAEAKQSVRYFTERFGF
ncbi:MAG: dihydrodipicolinate synthase family protein [Fimbriimonadales bacterium]